MNRFQWKWIFTGSKPCCTTWRPFWFAMVAILNQKFCFQHDRVKNWALIISCYVLTLFFIHTTSTCIVHLGDICSALRYSNQYFKQCLIFCCWVDYKCRPGLKNENNSAENMDTRYDLSFCITLFYFIL